MERRAVGKQHAAWYGVAASFVTGTTMLAAMLREERPAGAHVQAVIFGTVIAGFVVALLVALRLRALRIGTLIGLVIGASSAWQYLSQPVAHPFVPAAGTLALFAAIGFVFGGMVEFALFVHYLAHGGRPKDYPPI